MVDYKNSKVTEPLTICEFFSGAAFIVFFAGFIFFLMVL